MPEITKDMTIGDVLENYPKAEKVFLKHFGNGCFTCPGSKTEDIAFGANMHGLDADTIIAELNEAINS